MRKRRLITLSMFVFLVVAALSSFAGPAEAQPDRKPRYVVTYVEFQPRGQHGRGPSAQTIWPHAGRGTVAVSSGSMCYSRSTARISSLCSRSGPARRRSRLFRTRQRPSPF